MEHDADDDPDRDERDEHPDEERRLADWEPRELLTFEEEPPAPGAAMSVEIQNLRGDGGGRVVGRQAVGVGVADRPAGVAAVVTREGRHALILAPNPRRASGSRRVR